MNRTFHIFSRFKLSIFYALKGYNFVRSFFKFSRKDNTGFNPLTKDTIRKYNSTRIYLRQSKLCYAPFNNLYIGFEGKILACCYNRKYVLGTYPEQSLKQIWNGNKIQNLRNYIDHYDLSSGCESCKHKINEGALDTVWAKKFDEIPVKKNYPTQLDFELSNVCNLECIMCSGDFSSLIRKNKEKLEIQKNPYDDKFIEQLTEFIPHLTKANFLGGEPFLIDIYYKIWDKIIAINPECQIVIQTNASVLNEKIKSILEKGNVSINISIDSFQKGTYESIRIHADFLKIMQNIEFFISFAKKNNRFVGISVCPMQQNWKEIPEIINYCNEKNIPIVFNHVWHPPHCALWNLSEEELKNIFYYLSQFHFAQSTISQKKNGLQFHDLLNQIQFWSIESQSKNEKRTALELYTTDKLYLLLQQKINDSADITSEPEKQKILNRIDNLFNQFKEDPNYKNLIIKTLEIPVDVLIREFINNSDERLVEQIKQINYKNPS